jgi:hypothetical protein
MEVNSCTLKRKMIGERKTIGERKRKKMNR